MYSGWDMLLALGCGLMLGAQGVLLALWIAGKKERNGKED